MNLQDIYDLLESHLDNEICTPQEKMKRVNLPIPCEYGGGWATGETTEDAVRNLIQRLNLHLKKESPIFSECADKWLDIKKGEDRSLSTIKGYEYILKTHLKPYFIDKRVNDISADDIQMYFNSINGLSKSVSNQSKAILNGIFERAERNGWIDKNIMRFKYNLSSKTNNKVVLQDDDLINVISELEKLIATKDIRDYLYCCFLCFTSLRRGEILGLRWKDIFFETNEIRVVNNVTFPNGENAPHITHPKDNSAGIVHLQSGLRDRIEKYKRNPEDYIIFYNDICSDKPVTRSMFTKIWNRCNKILDLKGATSHSFRSSYATMLNAHCDHVDPKVLQGALRHKTPDLAIKVYTKENNSKTRKVEKEYDEWLSKKLAH